MEVKAKIQRSSWDAKSHVPCPMQKLLSQRKASNSNLSWCLDNVFIPSPLCIWNRSNKNISNHVTTDVQGQTRLGLTLVLPLRTSVSIEGSPYSFYKNTNKASRDWLLQQFHNLKLKALTSRREFKGIVTAEGKNICIGNGCNTCRSRGLQAFRHSCVVKSTTLSGLVLHQKYTRRISPITGIGVRI